ncbi:MAG: DMT family transporter [Actinomycetia bacterium]|nr:DMT family transporter [Actinomycetes bacterium]
MPSTDRTGAPARLRPTDPVTWGLLLAFGAAVGSAMGVIPYKVATDRAEPEYVVVALLVSAAILNTFGSIFSAIRGNDREPVDSVGGLAEVDVEAADPLRTEQPAMARATSMQLTIGVGILLGLIAAVANWTASEAITRLEVSIAQLLIQMQVLFAALLARIWLGEKVGRRFLGGALLALLGLAVMQGVGGASAGVAVLWGLGSAACFGSMQVITRRWIERIHPVVVNALRLWIAAAIVALVPGALVGAMGLPIAVIGLAAAAAACGPFLGRLMMMHSAHFIPAATSTLMGLFAPVLALGFGWMLLSELPSGTELLGGALVVAGMFVAVSGRARRTGGADRNVPAEAAAPDAGRESDGS